MTPNLTLIVIGGMLIAAGLYLILERSLTRILIGLLIGGNGVNILFLVASGAAGGPPIIGTTPPNQMSDPLPQAMVLTAIVITLATAAFVLTLAYRSFQLAGNDEVADDVEDAQIRQLAEADLASQSYDEADSSLPSEDERNIVSEEEPPDEEDDEEESDSEAVDSDESDPDAPSDPDRPDDLEPDGINPDGLAPQELVPDDLIPKDLDPGEPKPNEDQDRVSGPGDHR